MGVFQPRLKILPPTQGRLWPELEATPNHFTLYAGTALALHLGHRTSVDFDFLSNASFDPDQLARTIPYLKESERLQVSPSTIAGTKVAVVQKGAEAKDYLDIDALIRHGIDRSTALAAGTVVFGNGFNPFITLKALSYFDDLPTLPKSTRKRLTAAASAVDPTRLPLIEPFVEG